MADPSPSSGPGRSQARWRRLVGAWQPFTGHGVAAFAKASGTRLLLFQILVAGIIAVLVILGLRQTLFPAFETALAQLPEQARLRNSLLRWPGSDAIRLAENPWFDFVLTPTGTVPLGQTADLQFDLRPERLRINGAFGHLETPWPPDWDLDLGRIPATATWGAWRGPAQALAGGAVFGGLFVLWWTLATALVIPAWIGSRLAGRKIDICGVWRMTAAALLTGAVVAIVGLAGYTSGRWHLPGLLVSQGLHLLVGWIWLAWGILATPRGGPVGNLEQPAKTKAEARVQAKGRNPFRA